MELFQKIKNKKKERSDLPTKHIVMELFQKIKNKKRRDPTCRIRTSDLRMSVRDQLQSSALPTELRSDFDIAYQLLTYSIFYFYYIAK